MKELKQNYLIEKDIGDYYILTYILDNKDSFENIMIKDLFETNNCKVTVYWQSKFDKDIITLEEPKVYDAFNCIILARGTEFSLKNIIYKYEQRNKQIKYLEKCLSEGVREIKTWTEIEREKNPINYERLADTITASLFLQK